jgi:hypothetical protein
MKLDAFLYSVLVLLLFAGITSAQCVAEADVIMVSKLTGCKTITEGIKAAQKGQTVRVRLDTYSEEVTISKSIRVTGDISRNAKGEIQRPVILSKKATVVRLRGSDITLDGFEITNGLPLVKKNSDEGRTGILVEAPSARVVITNNKITNIGYEYETKYNKEQGHGINIWNYRTNDKIRDITIIGNELSDLHLGKSEALTINGSVEKFRIEDNYFHSIDNIAIDIGGFQENCPNNDSPTPCEEQASNGVIAGNIVSDLVLGNPGQNEDDDVIGVFIAGIYIDGGKDISIFGNQVFNFGIGISFGSEKIGKSVSGVRVLNNQIYDNIVAGIEIGKGGEQRSIVNDCEVRNNVIRDNGNIKHLDKYRDGGQIRLSQSLPNALNNLVIDSNDIFITDISKRKIILHAEHCKPANKCEPIKGKINGVKITNNRFYSQNYDEAWHFKGIDNVNSGQLKDLFGEFTNNSLKKISDL